MFLNKRNETKHFPHIQTQQYGLQTCHIACIGCRSSSSIHIHDDDDDDGGRYESKIQEIRTQQIERPLKKGICCLALRQGEEHADAAQLPEAVGQESFQVHAARGRAECWRRVQSAGHQRMQFTEQFHRESRIEPESLFHLAASPRPRQRGRRWDQWDQRDPSGQIEASGCIARH